MKIYFRDFPVFRMAVSKMKSFETDAHVGMEGSSISNVHGVTQKLVVLPILLSEKKK